MAAGATPFAKVWLASTGSNLGDGVVLTAVPLLAARLSDEPLAVAGVTFAAGLPWLAFSLVAGALVDRLDRRTVMVVVDLCRAAALAALGTAVLGGWIELWFLYTVMLLLGIGETLFDTAAQTILPAVVAGPDLEAANGQLFASQVVANQFVGPPLGGLLFSVGAALPLLLDATTFVASSLLLVTIRGTFRATGRAAGTTIAADIREGMTFLWNNHAIRALAIGAATINLSAAGTAALLVLFATDVLGLDPFGFGVLLACGALGGVLGSVYAARLTGALGRVRVLVSSVVAISVSLAWIGLSSSAISAGLAISLFGAASEVWNVVAVSHRQRVVPDHLLGRLNAAYRMLAYGALPIGALLMGGIADVAGIRIPYLAGAVPVALLASWLVVTRGRFEDARVAEPDKRPSVARST